MSDTGSPTATAAGPDPELAVVNGALVEGVDAIDAPAAEPAAAPETAAAIAAGAPGDPLYGIAVDPALTETAAGTPVYRDDSPPAGRRGPITRWLERTNSLLFVLFGGVTAFCVYFCMYAFRKPYAAGEYVNVEGWDSDLSLKAFLAMSQILGYALSKVVGVKVISEMPARRRAMAIIVLILVSMVGLLLFAVLPVQLKFVGMFVNGLPLGLIWGLVFGFLEGRRTTEILGALLSASFIVSSGIVKTISVWMMSALGVGEFWMPLAVGAIFLPLLFASVWLLQQLPAPSREDIAARTERLPMTAAQRSSFMKKYGGGVVLLCVGYILLTVFRDYRDDFAVEVWKALGYQDDPGVLTSSEIPVAIITLLAFAALILIRNNLRALLTIHVMALAGALIMGASVLLFVLGLANPFILMIGTGTGLYIAYMPFGAMLFERLIASTRQVANAGFLIYIADASGYLGTVVLLLSKNFLMKDLDWLSLFLWGGAIASIVSATCTAVAMVYFMRKLRVVPQLPTITVPAVGVGGAVA